MMNTSQKSARKRKTGGKKLIKPFKKHPQVIIQMRTIRGIVKRTGRVKEYRGFRGGNALKFYMLIDTEEYGKINVMVDVTRESGKITIPPVGSTISFQYGRTPKQNANGEVWLNIPYDRVNIEKPATEEVIEGTVERVGRPKGKGFYMLVKAGNRDINVMVRFPEDVEGMEEYVRRPYIGDIIRIRGYVERGNGLWMNITDRDWETIEARGKEAYIGRKRAEREAEKQMLRAEREEKTKRRIAGENGIINSLPADMREALIKARAGAEKMMSLERIIAVLRDTFWLSPISVGHGGVRSLDPEKGSVAGTGMRRPNGSLYEVPLKQREAILNRMEKAGLIRRVGGNDWTEVGKQEMEEYRAGRDAYNTYEATRLGARTLLTLDVDEDGNVRKPYMFKTRFGRHNQYVNETIRFLSDKEEKDILNKYAFSSIAPDSITPINHHRYVGQQNL